MLHFHIFSQVALFFHLLSYNSLLSVGRLQNFPASLVLELETKSRVQILLERSSQIHEVLDLPAFGRLLQGLGMKWTVSKLCKHRKCCNLGGSNHGTVAHVFCQIGSLSRRVNTLRLRQQRLVVELVRAALENAYQKVLILMRKSFRPRVDGNERHSPSAQGFLF